MTHALQALTSLDENATVVSIDGVGAFDLISSGAWRQDVAIHQDSTANRRLICGRMIGRSPTTSPRTKTASVAIR